MHMRIYRRSDGRTVMVPALFQSPVAIQREGALAAMGLVDVDLLEFSETLIDAMGEAGYAVAEGRDAAVINAALAMGLDQPQDV